MDDIAISYLPTRHMHEELLREQSLAEELARSIIISLQERRGCLGTPEDGPNSFVQDQVVKARLRTIKQVEALHALLVSIEHSVWLES